MESWLQATGAVGLDDLELADFPITGRGVRTLRRFKEGERILTIPCSSLWTVEHAYADSLLGPALRSVRPPLSVEDTLATYILFVRSRESRYDGLQSHVAALPTSYSSSIFFAEDELDVCAGTSLYTITKQLEQRIEADYRELVVRVLAQYRDLFPLDNFTIEDVGVLHMRVIDVANQLLTLLTPAFQYKWALCTVWSRAMDFVLPDGNSIRLLAPFADMLNHSSEVKQCHVYDALSKTLSVLAGKDYDAGDQVRSSRSLMVRICALTWEYSFRFLSTTDLFQIVVSYVSTALSYPAILTTAMISFLQRTLQRHFLSKSTSSGYQLDSIQLLPSPSLSPIRYRQMSFDTSAFSDQMNRNSLPWRFSKSMQQRKSAIRTKWKSCGFWWNRSVIF